jgi:hypothetical protein
MNPYALEQLGNERK